MNMKYGRLANGRVEYAPDSLDTGSGRLMNPSCESYLAAGWKRVVESPPPPEDGCAVAVSGWTETETTLARVYKQVPQSADPPPAGPEGRGGVGPRVFSKLRLVIALKAAGLWVLAKTWIEENGLYDHYLAAQEFAEDNELFVRGRDAIRELARKDEREVEAILAQCVKE